MSVNLVAGAFAVVPMAILTKKVDFRTQMVVGILAVLLSGVVAVIMGFCGCGIWSLASLTIATNIARSLLLWAVLPWRPALVLSLQSLRGMFPFGSRLLLAGLLDAIFQNIYLVVIGKAYSAVELGYFTHARALQQIPTRNLCASVVHAAFPVLASIQHDRSRLKRGVRKAQAVLAMLSFPLMIGLAISAEPLVVVLLTEKWLPCVPYLQLLCAAGALYPLNAIHLAALKARGRSDLFLRIELLKKILIIAAIAATIHWGIIGLVCGQIATAALAYLLHAYCTQKLLGYSWGEQLADTLPSLAAASAMGSGIYLLQLVVTLNPAALLAAQIVLAPSLYILLCRIFGLSPFLDLLAMAARRRSRCASPARV
jgi:O-antigen/teichoic acid export membrane protein